jgi:hypothetical protein
VNAKTFDPMAIAALAARSFRYAVVGVAKKRRAPRPSRDFR